jgi:CMP/dCMP kinase
MNRGTKDRPIIIALDGPAAAGKGTLARALARHFNLAYLDTGSLYRGVGLSLIRRGEDPGNSDLAIQAAQSLAADILADRDIRSEAAGEAASKVAAIPGVRAALLAWQRRFAEAPGPGFRGAVLDGRDIGTVVCPDAEVKIFVTASAETRARRRFQELQDKGEAAIYARVLQDLLERDQRDAARATAPMQSAADARILDTSALDIQAMFDQAKAIVDRRLKEIGRAL